MFFYKLTATVKGGLQFSTKAKEKAFAAKVHDVVKKYVETHNGESFFFVTKMDKEALSCVLIENSNSPDLSQLPFSSLGIECEIKNISEIKLNELNTLLNRADDEKLTHGVNMVHMILNMRPENIISVKVVKGACGNLQPEMQI